MDQEVALMGALCVCAFLVAVFMVFTTKIGVISAIGKEPLSNRKFLALGLAALIPPAAGFMCIEACGVSGALEHPMFLAVGMASVAAASHWAFGMLEIAALKNDPSKPGGRGQA